MSTPHPHDGLPETWSASARETYLQIDDDNPDATAAQRAALFEAVSLLAHADALDATIPTHGYMIPGSTGQLVVNPAVAEVRALRRDALGALRAAGLTTARGRGGDAASAAGAALVAKRWGNR